MALDPTSDDGAHPGAVHRDRILGAHPNAELAAMAELLEDEGGASEDPDRAEGTDAAAHAARSTLRRIDVGDRRFDLLHMLIRTWKEQVIVRGVGVAVNQDDPQATAGRLHREVRRHERLSGTALSGRDRKHERTRSRLPPELRPDHRLVPSADEALVHLLALAAEHELDYLADPGRGILEIHVDTGVTKARERTGAHTGNDQRIHAV
jgi:hypothetical protein